MPAGTINPLFTSQADGTAIPRDGHNWPIVLVETLVHESSFEDRHSVRGVAVDERFAWRLHHLQRQLIIDGRAR